MFGVHKEVIKGYQKWLKEKEASERMAERIKKWKSVVPRGRVEKEEGRCMTEESYHRLF